MREVTSIIKKSVDSIKNGAIPNDSKRLVLDILEEVEIDGIKNNASLERVAVLCTSNKGHVSSFSFIDAKADEVSAVLNVSAQDIRDNCPSPNILTYLHTHNLSTGTMSNTDRKSATDLFLTGLGDGLCAIGIDKISCHYPQTTPPTIIDIPMRKHFYKRLLKSIDGENQKESKIVKLDSVTCLKNSRKNTFSCSGKYWQDGLKEFPVGAFERIIGVDVTSDYGINFVGMFDEKMGRDDSGMQCAVLSINEKERTLICLL